MILRNDQIRTPGSRGLSYERVKQKNAAYQKSWTSFAVNLIILSWRIPHLYLCIAEFIFPPERICICIIFVHLNYLLLSPEPIEAIFRPIHSENWRPGVSLRYPPVSLKNNHLEYKHNYNQLEYKHNYNHLEYKHNNAMNTNRTRMHYR